MKKANFKKIFAVLVSLMLIAVMAFTFASCTENKGEELPETSTPTAESSVDTPETTENSAEVTVLGEGKNQFDFKVTHKNGIVKKFEIKTNFSSVGAALSSLKVIAGDDSEYGLYVKTVDGETLDYDTDGMYWAFYENGNYASAGIDQTTITDGVIYELRAEK